MKFRKRRGVAAIVGGVVLFAVIFSVAGSYFLFVVNTNSTYGRTLLTTANDRNLGLAENLIVGTALTGTTIQFSVTNAGGVSANVTAVYVISSTGSILWCYFKDKVAVAPCNNSTTGLPLVVAVGLTSSTINTGYTTYVTGTTVTVDVITARGREFTANYPPTSLTLVQVADSGAIGDLYLSFQSYTLYSVAGNTLTQVGKAFAIQASSYAGGHNIAFSVRVTDFNPQQENIVLDAYTLLSLIPESGAGSLGYTDWYVVNNSTNTIQNTYTPIILQFNKPQTIVFASSAALQSPTTFSAQSAGTIHSGSVTPLFIITHGCEGAGQVTCTASSANYGQNSAYVNSLWY